MRAVFPNAQFIHGEEGGREIGKRPALPANAVELDFYLAMEMASIGMSTKGKKRG